MKQEWTHRKILKFVFSVSPIDFLVMFFVGLFQCALASFGIFLTRDLFKAIEFSISNGLSDLPYALFALYAVYIFLSSSCSYLFARYIIQFKMLPRFEHRMLQKMHEKARCISSEQMQTPDIERLLQQANGARQALFRYGEICITIVIAVLQTLAVTVSITSLNVWYLFFMPLALATTFIKQWQQSRLLGKSLKDSAQLKREEVTYEKAIVDETACKETRVCCAGEIFLNKWTHSRNKRDLIEDNISHKMHILKWYLVPLELAGNVAGILVSGVLMWHQIISFSVFTAGVNAYETLLRSYQQLVETMGYQRQYFTMLQPFFHYWSYPERLQNSSHLPNQMQVEMKHVSFQYPKQNHFAIRDVSITLKEGEVLAIVGENGAGKTTLARLLMGLYQPTEGFITYDGTNLSDFGEAQLHVEQSIVDQNFCRYKLTAEENVTLGDVHKCVDKTSLHTQLKDILPQTETTVQLGREFGGIDLSGGQWQRLACLRGFYKNSKLIALDEPTSALDPLQEKCMYDNFAAQLEGRSGIIITHRLGAVRFADKIAVLSNGTLIEIGTHDELMQKAGNYASMWKSQANQYV